MPKGSMRVLVKNLPETNPKTRTEPAWKKPVVEYPKDATIVEIPYKWDRKPAKPGKKEKQKPKPITVRKQKPPKKAEPKKEKIKRTIYTLSDNDRRNWTQEDVETLIRMYTEGASYIEISEAVRHAESSIAAKLTQLRKEGRITSVRSNEAWTQEQIDTLLEMKAQGHTIVEICEVV